MCPTPCGPPGRAWVRFEWLFWVATGQSLPPLVAAAPAGTARPVAGVLGQPTTAVLFGGNRGNNDFRNGFRITGGLWLNEAQTFGLQGNFFFLGQSRDQFAAGSNGSQVITRPFFNALLGRQDAELVSFPGALAGTVTASSQSNVIGAGVNAVHNLCCNPCGRIDLLYGYQYFNLRDQVEVQENLTSLGGAARVPPGSTIQVLDRFRTSNNFNGGVIGLATERRYSSLFVGVQAAVALGANTQTADIEGQTIITPPGGTPMVSPGGLLAQPSNIGHYSRTMFAVMPMVGVRAGMQVTNHARVYAGYNVMYLSNVLRAGDQIDTRVNPALIPPGVPGVGPALPAFPAHSTDFWLHGVSLGVELRY